MSNSSFTLKVVTPAGIALEDEVAEVYLPSSRGEIGILPGHAKYTSLLGTGVLSYSRHGQVTNAKMVVSEGFCNFSNDTLTVLADTVDLPDMIDRVALEKLKSEARSQVDTLDPTDPMWQAARVRIARCEAVEKIL